MIDKSIRTLSFESDLDTTPLFQNLKRQIALRNSISESAVPEFNLDELFAKLPVFVQWILFLGLGNADMTNEEIATKINEMTGSELISGTIRDYIISFISAVDFLVTSNQGVWMERFIAKGYKLEYAIYSRQLISAFWDELAPINSMLAEKLKSYYLSLITNHGIGKGREIELDFVELQQLYQLLVTEVDLVETNRFQIEAIVILGSYAREALHHIKEAGINALKLHQIMISAYTNLQYNLPGGIPNYAISEVMEGEEA